ncbi:MAG: sigma-E processing peptidase SpoIIGA [Bacillaceae bacterium]
MVYVDIVFLLNILVDYCILLITTIALKRNVTYKRLILGALVGSVLVLLQFTPMSIYSNHVLIKVFFSICIVLVTFGYRELVYTLKNLFMFYFSTFIFGGFVIGTHYLLQTNYPALTNSLSSIDHVYGDPISWVFVFICIPICMYFIKKEIHEISFTKLRYEKIVKIEVKIKNFVFHSTALIDNGNQLTDPLTGKPIIVVDQACLEGKIPEAIIKLVKEPFIDYDNIDDEWATRIRIVPFQVVGNKNNWMVTIRSDEVVIYGEKKIVTCKNIMIGINAFAFTSAKEYQCILHPKLVVG